MVVFGGGPQVTSGLVDGRHVWRAVPPSDHEFRNLSLRDRGHCATNWVRLLAFLAHSPVEFGGATSGPVGLVLVRRGHETVDHYRRMVGWWQDALREVGVADGGVGVCVGGPGRGGVLAVRSLVSPLVAWVSRPDVERLWQDVGVLPEFGGV